MAETNRELLQRLVYMFDAEIGNCHGDEYWGLSKARQIVREEIAELDSDAAQDL